MSNTAMPLQPVNPTSRNAIIIGSVLAGAQMFANAADLSNLLPNTATAWIGLLVGVVTLMWTNYNQAFQVVPVDSVAAVVDIKTGSVVAGPASADANGTPVDVRAAA